MIKWKIKNGIKLKRKYPEFTVKKNLKYSQLRGILRTQFSSFIKVNEKQCWIYHWFVRKKLFHFKIRIKLKVRRWNENLRMASNLKENVRSSRSKKTWNILNWDRHSAWVFSTFIKENKKKTMFEFIINLSARNCSISRFELN